MADTVSALLAVRRGHFQMESGYHSGSWFELGSLFDHPDELRPFVTELARRLAAHGPDAVCGPETGGAKLAQLIAHELGIGCFGAERFDMPEAIGLFPVKYRLPQAQRQKARGRSIALGAFVVFGDAAAQFAAETGLALEAIERMPFDMWQPIECPLCRASVALETIAAN